MVKDACRLKNGKIECNIGAGVVKLRLLTERRTPRGIIEYWIDEKKNVYTYKGGGKLELIGSLSYECDEETDCLIIDNYCIQLDIVNGFPPEELPRPEED